MRRAHATHFPRDRAGRSLLSTRSVRRHREERAWTPSNSWLSGTAARHSHSPTSSSESQGMPSPLALSSCSRSWSSGRRSGVGRCGRSGSWWRLGSPCSPGGFVLSVVLVAQWGAGSCTGLANVDPTSHARESPRTDLNNRGRRDRQDSISVDGWREDRPRFTQIQPHQSATLLLEPSTATPTSRAAVWRRSMRRS